MCRASARGNSAARASTLARLNGRARAACASTLALSDDHARVASTHALALFDGHARAANGAWPACGLAALADAVDVVVLQAPL